MKRIEVEKKRQAAAEQMEKEHTRIARLNQKMVEKHAQFPAKKQEIIESKGADAAKALEDDHNEKLKRINQKREQSIKAVNYQAYKLQSLQHKPVEVPMAAPSLPQVTTQTPHLALNTPHVEGLKAPLLPTMDMRMPQLHDMHMPQLHAPEIPRNTTVLLSEFLGTFILVFAVGNAIRAGCSYGTLAIASALMVAVYATAAVSGGYLNPAVTFFLALNKKIAWSMVPCYWVAQLLGGVVASALFTVFSGATPVGPRAPFGWQGACAAEFLYTFMLCLVVGCCAVSKVNNPKDDGNQFFGLAIGFVIIAGGFAAGLISGACFNPAVSLGLGIMGGGMRNALVYTLFEMSAAVIAYIIYCLVRPETSFKSSREPGEFSIFNKLLSEFLGTFILAITVCLNLLTGSKATAFSAAAAYMCMIYSLGNVSGGHFNPAVTVAVVTSGRGMCRGTEGVCYVVTQMFAGCLAGWVATRFCHDVAYSSPLVPIVSDGATTMACVAEAVFTFVLCFVVLAVAIAKPQPSVSKQSWQLALAIGSCVTAGGFAIGGVSGGYLNPAVTFGAVFLGAADANSVSVWLSTSQLVGAVLAALVFEYCTHRKEYTQNQDWCSLVAEFIGTFVLTFTFGCCVYGPNSVSEWNATAIACSLMIMVYALGNVSGAHLNPAVTFFSGLLGKIPWHKAGTYVLVQVLGGLLAARCSMLVTGANPSMLGPKSPHTWTGACCVETLYTCMLCLVVGCVAVSKVNNPDGDGNGYFGLAIGFVYVAGGYAAGDVSGACFNPAVSIGLGWMNGWWNWGYLYTLYELAGASFAAVLYKLVSSNQAGPELISEFTGTFFLVATFGLNIVCSKLSQPMTAWSAAAALMCMVYSLGSTSGAHFNPAVTLAVFFSENTPMHEEDTFRYWLVQTVAAVCGGFLVSRFRSGTEVCKLRNGFTPLAWLVELIFTFVLAFVVLAVATTDRKRHIPSPTNQNHFFGLAIGMCMVAAFGAISGGELNPSVALGISTGCGLSWDLLPLVLCELVGGWLAAEAFT